MIIFLICSAIFAIQFMIIALVLLFITSICCLIRYSLLTEFMFISEFLHPICLQLLPENPKTQATLQALVCGHNFETYADTKLYTSSGLIHLFVVSGSHLLIIYKLLSFLFKRINLQNYQLHSLFLIFFYSAVCQFNPPVMRSFLGLLIFTVLEQFHKYWPRNYVLLVVGLLCLAVNWRWVDSLSLQMSWLAALAIELNQRYLKNKSLLQQFSFYFMYLFTFCNLGFPQVSIVVIALFFTPFLEFILLPLAFLILIFPFFDSFFEVILVALNIILSHLEMHLSPPTITHLTVSIINWNLILLLHLFLHFNHKKT